MGTVCPRERWLRDWAGLLRSGTARCGLGAGPALPPPAELRDLKPFYSFRPARARTEQRDVTLFQTHVQCADQPTWNNAKEKLQWRVCTLPFSPCIRFRCVALWSLMAQCSSA